MPASSFSHSSPTAATVAISGLSFAWPDGSVVLDRIDLTLTGRTHALVGANGAGKSTLLALLAGRLTPTAGSVSVGPGNASTHNVSSGTGSTEVALVEQNPQTDPSVTVAQALGVAQVRGAIRRIEQGSTDPSDFDIVGDDWDLDERATGLLRQMALPTDLDRRLGELSGGEATLLAIVAALLSRPRVLLLDEPTNNLDGRSRTVLFDAIDTFSGTVVVVSHDLELLERVDATVELYQGRVRVFGGPYSHYRAVLDAEQKNAEAAVSAAHRDLRKQRRELVDAQIKLDRRRRTAATAEREKRVPKIIAHKRRAEAQVSAGKLRSTHRDDVDEAATRLDEARADVRDDLTARIVVPEVEVAPRTQIITSDLLRVDGPERIAVDGPNGSGKSTLLARLVAEDAIAVPYGLVPQRITFDDPSSSIADHLARRHPAVGTQDVRAHLARFLFRGTRAERALGELSGGERLRVALADALLGVEPPKLLILDEPTNNLDLDTVAQLVDALTQWRGALVVVSHDEGFLDRIDIRRRAHPPRPATEPRPGRGR